MLDFIKKHKYLFASFGIVILFYSYYIVFNDSIFIIAGDAYEQQYKFYVEAWQRLRDCSLPFWDWSNFLGANYYGSMTYYQLGSPFFWLAMLSPNAKLIPYSFLYLVILKSLLCVCFTYIWIKKVFKDEIVASIAGLIITFSGFYFNNACIGFLFDAVVFCPLVLYFVECFLQNNNKIGLLFSTAYIGIINYYVFYLFIWFECIYGVIRYFAINKKVIFSKFLKDAFSFAICIIFGFGISLITVLPSFYALQGNPKSSELIISFNTIGKLNIYRFLTSFITPTCDYRTNSNYFISMDVDQGIGWVGGFPCYSFILSVYSIILLFFIKDKKRYFWLFILLLVYLVFAIFPTFYVLFNQNYETRWMFVFPFIMVCAISSIIKNKNYIERKYFIISSIIVVAIILLALFISIYFGFANVGWEVSILIRNCICLILIVLLYALILFNNKLRNSPLIFFVVSLEILLSFKTAFYSLDTFNEPMNLESLEKYNHLYKGAGDYIVKNDNGFYRIDKDSEYSGFGNNDSYFQRYKSFYGYNSVYNYNQLSFLEDRFTTRSCVFSVQNGKDILKSMLGNKYWFTYKKEENYLIPYGYSYYASTDDGAKIYKNDYPVTFAYFRDKTTSVDSFKTLDILHQDYLLLDHVILEQANKSDINQLVDVKEIKKYGDYIENLDVSDKNGYIYISYNNDIHKDEKYKYPNWQFEVDGKTIGTNALQSELSYVGLPIPKDADLLECNHIISTTIYYDDMSWYDNWYNSQVMVDPDSVVWDDNSISGTITTEKDGYIVTSVPYDSGWTVKLDGKKIDYLKVNEGFVGFTITPGSHTIEMNYVPPGLVVGSIISVVSLLVCFLLEKKRKVL